MPKNTPKFSLYCLPFIGAFTYLLCDLFYIYVDVSPENIYSVFRNILIFLGIYSSSEILLSTILFLILIPILRFFNLNKITLKNTLVIIGFTVLYKVYALWIFGEIIIAIYNGEKYRFILDHLFIVTRLGFIFMLIIPLTLFLYLFKSYLNRYEGYLPEGQKKWLLANLLSIAGIFSLILWICSSLATYFISLDIFIANISRGDFFFYLPTFISLSFMILSKKIMLTDIKIRTSFITAAILAAFALLLIIISASLLDGAGYGAYIILPFLLVSVPIATIIFTIVIVNKMYSRYK